MQRVVRVRLRQLKLANEKLTQPCIPLGSLNRVPAVIAWGKGVLGRSKGDFRLLSGFWSPNLPAFAWRAAGDMSAEEFSISEPSA